MAHCAGENWPNARLSQALTLPFKIYKSQFYNWLNCTIMTSSFLLCKVFIGKTKWHAHDLMCVYCYCSYPCILQIHCRLNCCCSLLLLLTDKFSHCKRFNFDRWNDAITNRPPHVGLITVSNHHCCVDDPGLLGNYATVGHMYSFSALLQ